MNTYTCQKTERLDAFLSRESGISRSKIKKLIENTENSFIKVDGRVTHDASQKLAEGQEVSVIIPEYTSPLQAEHADIPILYKDEHIAIVDKPARLIVHPSPSCQSQTLAHHLLALFPELQSVEGLRPGIVHRLDKETSGLMIIALTEEARLSLTEDFAARNIEKTYLALCDGSVPVSGECKEPLGRHPTNKTKRAVLPLTKGGKEAHTEWQVLYPKNNTHALAQSTAHHTKNIPDLGTSRAKNLPEKQNFSLVAVQIHTGRTHQIRVHMNHIGHPLLGDKVYGKQAHSAGRHMLHAWKIAFHHPVNHEPLSFCSTPSEDFMATLRNNLKKDEHRNKLIITGNAGSGKSFVTKILNEKGYAVFSADTCINELYQPNGDGWHLLRGHYGLRFTPDDDKPVDRVSLAFAMRDDRFRKEINAILHPLVFAHLEDFFREHETDDLCIAEIPLWHESQQNYASSKKNLSPKASLKTPLNNKPPMLLTICCDAEIRHARLETRGWGIDTIAYADAWQWTQEDKAQASDYVIENNEKTTNLYGKVDALLLQIQKDKDTRVLSIYEKIEEYLNNSD